MTGTRKTRRMYWKPALVLAALWVPGCATSPSCPDAAGIYEGVLPSADGPGLEVAVYLYPPDLFFVRRVYLKTPDQAYFDTGRWELGEDNRLRLVSRSGGVPWLFRVEADRLVPLDGEGKEIRSGLPNLFLYRVSR